MNLQDKTRIFGHYLFSSVKAKDTTIIMQSIDGNTGCVTAMGNTMQLPIEDCKLVLKDIKHVTKAEAIKCAALAGLPASLVSNWEVQHTCTGETIFSWPGEDCNYRNIIHFKSDKLNCEQIDYLRAQGYALGIPKEVYTLEDKK